MCIEFGGVLLPMYRTRHTQKPFTAEDAKDAEVTKVAYIYLIRHCLVSQDSRVAKAGYGRMQKQHENLCRKTRILDIAIQGNRVPGGAPQIFLPLMNADYAEKSRPLPLINTDEQHGPKPADIRVKLFSEQQH